MLKVQGVGFSLFSIDKLCADEKLCCVDMCGECCKDTYFSNDASPAFTFVCKVII